MKAAPLFLLALASAAAARDVVKTPSFALTKNWYSDDYPFTKVEGRSWVCGLVQVMDRHFVTQQVQLRHPEHEMQPAANHFRIPAQAVPLVAGWTFKNPDDWAKFGVQTDSRLDHRFSYDGSIFRAELRTQYREDPAFVPPAGATGWPERIVIIEFETAADMSTIRRINIEGFLQYPGVPERMKFRHVICDAALY